MVSDALKVIWSNKGYETDSTSPRRLFVVRPARWQNPPRMDDVPVNDCLASLLLPSLTARALEWRVIGQEFDFSSGLPLPISQ